jgi:hypothetical protein
MQAAGNKRFDPFAGLDEAPAGSKSWLWATAIQALLTSGLVAIDLYYSGTHWERFARLIVLIGVVGTWSLALRTIRERLVELMRYWHSASRGLLRRASESGQHLVTVPLSDTQEETIKGTIWRLRIIAAGLTIPFLVMPAVWALISMVLYFAREPMETDCWAGVALFMSVSALIVAGYLHWTIVPRPIYVSGFGRRFYPPRRRA